MNQTMELTQWPTLKDLIVPGPVERGFYFMDASVASSSLLQDRLIDLLWWDSVASPGLMPACLPGRQAYRFPAQLKGHPQANHRRYSRIGSMYWIDTGHSFNASSLLSQARQKGLDGERAARAVRLSKPAGALSYLEELERIPNAALCALSDSGRSNSPTAFARGSQSQGVRAPNSVWWTPLVIISDLLGPLTDPRIPSADRTAIVSCVYERLEHLRERAVVIAMIRSGDVDQDLLNPFLKLGARIFPDRSDVWQPELNFMLHSA